MEITKEKFVKFYIDENHTQKECCDYFQISKNKVIKYIHEFDCHKPKTLAMKGVKVTRTHESYVLGGKKSSETQKKNWKLKSQEEKDLWVKRCSNIQLNLPEDKVQEMVQKRIATNSNKSQEEKDKINQKRKNSLLQYWKNLSKTDYQTKVKEKTDKTYNTCLEKYGVPFACMREEARMHGNNSKPNKDFAKILDGLNISYKREFIIDKYSFDFRLGNTLIEINPSITHNSTFSPFGHEPLSKDYHFNKTKTAVENGYRCISVWDWDNLDAVLNLLTSSISVGARKCKIKEISFEESSKFISTYHVQGNAKSSIQIGLFYEDELVSVMTFGKPRYNKKYEYELIRYCSCMKVIGGAEKLFNYFKTKYNPTSIISYCDLSKFNGSVYDKLGFSKLGVSVGKHWYNPTTGKHITDNLLRQRGFDQLFHTDYGKGTSNEELMLLNGFLEIFDSGQATYAWKNSI